jgi:hypothetical protein
MNVSGGDKLTKKLADISNSMKGDLEVGFFEGETYPDGTSLPTVAAQNEFGDPAKKIPPRPFFRTTISKNSDEWGNLVAKAAKFYNYDEKQVLSVLGQKIKEQIQDSIRSWDSPPNAPRTIEKKGFNNPLVDTRQLLNSPEYKVK